MLAYKKKTMTQLWALAIVAMFVCCAFSVCAASDWSMAEEEESESGSAEEPGFDPEILGYLGKILSEEQLDVLFKAIEIVNEQFPVDLDGELLPMLSFMLDMKINVGEDYDDNGADIRHLDKDHNELTGDETVIVLEDGAKLEFSKDLAVDTIIIAGKDVTIAGTEGAKLIFKTLKFPCLTLFGDDDDAETAKPYEMIFDNGSKLLLSYSATNGLFEVVDEDLVPAEEKKVSLDLSLGVAGTSVTIHQVDYELKDEHYDNYAYNDTVFTSNSGNNIAFSFDADLTAIYSDLLAILDGSGPIEVPFKTLAAIAQGDLHMPDLKLSLSSDAVETVNSYSDHYTFKEGEVIKEESTWSDKDFTKVDGVSLSFATVSETSELNLAFNVGSVLQTEDKSNHNSQIDEATKEKTENGYTRGEKTELNGLLAKVAVKNGSVSAEIGLNNVTHSESREDETNSDMEETSVKDLKLVADLKYEGLKALISAVVGGLSGSDGEESETGLADIIKNLDVSGVNLGASFQFDLGELRVTDGDTHFFENVEGDRTETLSNVLIKDLHLSTSILKGKAAAEIRLGALDVVEGRETPTTLYSNNVGIEQFFITLDINTDNFLAFVIEALSGMNGGDDEEDEEEESSETVSSFPEYLFGLDMSELYAGDSIAIGLGVFNLSTKDLSKDEFPAADYPNLKSDGRMDQEQIREVLIERFNFEISADTDGNASFEISFQTISIKDLDDLKYAAPKETEGKTSETDGPVKDQVIALNDRAVSVSETHLKLEATLPNMFEILKLLFEYSSSSDSSDAIIDEGIPSYQALDESEEGITEDDRVEFDPAILIKLLENTNGEFVFALGSLKVNVDDAQLPEDNIEPVENRIAEFAVSQSSIGILIGTDSVADIEIAIGGISLHAVEGEYQSTPADTERHIDIENIDFTFKANAIKLADVLKRYGENPDLVENFQAKVALLTLLLDTSGAKIHFSVGTTSIEFVDIYNRYSEESMSVELVAPRGLPAFSLDVEVGATVVKFDIFLDIHGRGSLSDGATFTAKSTHSGEDYSHETVVDVDVLLLGIDETFKIPLGDLASRDKVFEDMKDLSVSVTAGFKVVLADVDEGAGVLNEMVFDNVKAEVPLLKGEISDIPVSFDKLSITSICSDDVELIGSAVSTMTGLTVETHTFEISEAEIRYSEEGERELLAANFIENGKSKANSDIEKFIGYLVQTDKGFELLDESEDDGVAVFLTAVEPSEPEIAEDGSASTTIDTHGSNSVAISDKLAEELVDLLGQGSGNNVQVILEGGSDKAVEVSISKDSVQLMKDKDSGFEIESSAGSIKLDAATVGTIAGTAGSSVDIKMNAIGSAELSEMIDKELLDKVGKGSVVSIDLTVDGNNIHILNGVATISVPYKLTAGTLKVSYLNEETKELEEIEGATYDSAMEVAVFAVPHLSLYSIESVDDGDDDLNMLMVAAVIVVGLVVFLGVAAVIRAKAGKTN